MLEAVIFDMDGVIIDSEPAHLEVNKRIFKFLGIKVSPSEYQSFIGLANKSMWTFLKEKHNLMQSVDELVKMQVTGNLEYLRNEDIEPIEGIEPLLTELQTKGMIIGLASSSPMDAIETVLDKFNIRQYFSCLVSGANMRRGKPAPDIYLKTAKLLNIPPQKCVAIEDSTNGVKSAKAAGMKCIGFVNPHSGKQDLSLADVKVTNFLDCSLDTILSLYLY